MTRGMDYELAKKLKDAGFPQNKTEWIYNVGGVLGEKDDVERVLRNRPPRMVHGNSEAWRVECL